VVVNELSLEVSRSCNCKVIRIFDTSKYCGTDIENYLIEVQSPTISKWATFHVLKGFSLVLNSSSILFQQVPDSSKLVDLPDGIYDIKQSYKPNIDTLVHYYHLRTCSLRSKIRSEWVKLLSKECRISRNEFYDNRDKLREIDEYIMGAEFLVEEKLKKREGKEMYSFAEKLLEDYGKQCRC